MDKKLTPAQAWEKIKHYCAWQERCHTEVKEKLSGYSIYGQEADIIISRLIEENYLNEERFAIQFAGGHFRSKQWGRQKIKYALRQKQVSDWCIQQALKTIEDDDYGTTFEKLAQARWKALAGKTPAIRWANTRDYLLRKGYESAMVMAWLQQASAGKGSRS